MALSDQRAEMLYGGVALRYLALAGIWSRFKGVMTAINNR